jgi:hypothetical protein
LASAPSPGQRIRRVELPAIGPADTVAGLDVGRLGLHARAEALSRIGSLAGNRAVARLVGRVRADMPLDPPDGVREIRRVGSGGTLGHTRSLMDPTPPLFRLPAPAAADGGYTARPAPTRAPALDFEVRWPTPGRHILYEATTSSGAPANTYLQVTDDWSATILKGEEEHVDDQTIAWRETWSRVADIVNAMAAEPPVRGTTPEAASRASWARFVSRLPGPLRPAGADPSESAQLAKWDFADRSSVFRTLVGESKRARDVSQWHTPDASLDHMEDSNEIRTLSAGSSQIGVTLPEDLMRDAWNRLPNASGGAAQGGGRSGR